MDLSLTTHFPLSGICEALLRPQLASEMSLTVGTIFPSADAAVGAAKTFCDKQNRQYRIKKRDKGRIGFCCPAGQGCRFEVKLSSQADGNWKIHTSNCNHTCSGAVRRERAPGKSVVETVSDVVSGFVPQADSTGNAKQLSEMAKRVDGVDIGLSQARNIVADKAQSGIRDAFAQFSLLESVVSQMRNEDPSSTFTVDVAERFVGLEVERQLEMLYCAPGSSKSAFSR